MPTPFKVATTSFIFSICFCSSLLPSMAVWFVALDSASKSSASFFTESTSLFTFDMVLLSWSTMSVWVTLPLETSMTAPAIISVERLSSKLIVDIFSIEAFKVVEEAFSFTTIPLIPPIKLLKYRVSSVISSFPLKVITLERSPFPSDMSFISLERSLIGLMMVFIAKISAIIPIMIPTTKDTTLLDFACNTLLFESSEYLVTMASASTTKLSILLLIS